VVFIGSETGDSHLLQLNSSGGFSIVETFESVAPIGDAVLADLDNSGKPAIVTCSGEGHTGSLRIIRTGATIEQLASFDGVKEVQRTFSLTSGTSKYLNLFIMVFRLLTVILRLQTYLLFTSFIPRRNQACQHNVYESSHRD
jgi:hypothetical protein